MHFRDHFPIIAIILGIVASLVFNLNGEFWTSYMHSCYQLFCLSGISIFLLIYVRKQIVITWLDVSLIGILSLELVGRAVRLESLWELDELQILILPVYYIGVKSIDFTKENIKRYYILLLLLGIILCCYTLLEWNETFKSENLYWKITGNFSNPGPLGGFLALLFSIAVAMYINCREQSPDVSFSIVLCICSLVLLILCILLCESRAALLASIISIFSYVTLYTKHKKLALAIWLLCIPVGIIIVFSKSLGSINGRLFIWKISFNMIQNKLLFGSGYHFFVVDFPHCLANFFATGSATNADIQKATVVDHVFNEFIQFFVENGLTGMGILIIFIILLIRSLCNKELKEQAKMVRNSSIGFLLTFCVFAQFSYPLSFLCFQLLLLHQIALLSNYSSPIKFQLNPLVLAGIRILIIAVSILGTKRIYQGCKLWYTAHVTEFSQPALSQKLYKTASPLLINQGNFLYYYAYTLKDIDVNMSTQYFERCEQLLSSPALDQKLGHNYELMQRIDQAEKVYLRAHFTVPLSLAPQRELMYFYNRCGRPEKARYWAKQLLATHLAHETAYSQWMKAQAKCLLYDK